VEDNKDNINSINWNELLKQDAFSIDGVSLGQVQGLFEPFVVIEKGNLSKETYYIPKSVIEKNDQNALYFRLTEEEIKYNCLRDSAPSEEDASQIQITAERLASSPRTITLHSPEEEILRKIKAAAGEFKEITLSITRGAKEKIEENQAQKDAQKISKMGRLAATFTDSFDQVMTEIKTAHTYEEQEQIYDGFIKLLEQQRELLLARKELASKLKSSVTESLSNRQVDDTKMPETAKIKQNEEKTRATSEQLAGGFVRPAEEASTTTS
jgi:hypothetical protein